MNTKHLALTAALTLAAAPLLADGASSRHPSGSSGSSGHSSSGGSSHSSSGSSGSSWSGSSSHHDSSSHEGQRGDSRGDHHGGRHYGGHDRVRVYGSIGAYWGYPYYGYYDGYYGPYYGGYYGWRTPYTAYRYVYDGNYGSLRIMVEPDDTEVYVDGYYAGQVDSFDGVFQRLHVRPGRHEIALKRAGFRTHRIRLYVPVGGTLKVRYAMERGTGVDPREDVVGSPDAVPEDEPRAAAPPRSEAAEPEEAPSATRTGELRLLVKPADAAVYVDGVFRGNAEDVAELDVPPGKHRVEVVRPGYVTFEKDILVGPGQSVDQRVELARRGGAL